MMPGAIARLAVVILFVGGGAGAAVAHATLRRAEPPVDGRVPLPPRQLRLEFSEAVVPRTSRVDLMTPDSQRFALQVTGDSAMASVLVAHVPELRVAGAFRVEWRLVGRDGHAVSGKYGFTVDSIPGPIDTAVTPSAADRERHEPSPDTLAQEVIRFASSLALVAVIGSIAFAMFVLPAVSTESSGESTALRDSIHQRLISLGSAGGWSLLVLAAARLVSHGATLSGSAGAVSIGDLDDLLTGSTFGRGWMLQVAAAIALLLVLRSKTSARWRVLAGIAVALAISASLLGHPAAVMDMPVLAVGLDAVHALAAGGWAGAILVMSIAALPQVARVAADHRWHLARNLLGAFSPLALTCASVLVLTGAASAWLQIRDLSLLIDSGYGLALVRKVVTVLLVVALGAYHWRVVRQSMDTERAVARLRISIAVDVALVLVVLVLTAVLTGTAPPPR
jgi:copper transport protein